MTSNVFAIAAAQGAPATQASSSSAGTGSIDSMFLQLLITQLKSQDPMAPMDPSTFVNQLAQVTTLDQLTQINQLLQITLGSTSSKPTGSSSGGH